MLELKKIVKVYDPEGNTVTALKGVTINFRKNEFVAILGPSGCGKTTLLNVIGGLDQYTTGNLIISGKSTKHFKDHDWDSYRNHSIGFVFQNYNLISHQTVLKNVELALTLSGVGAEERKKRAISVLKSVGLDDQIDKKPNQLSGGQQQRVAIARAMVNNPEILLADEPTGALDTETSVQVMELLKKIAKDRLVIMVTHNPKLADTYSTRIIKLLDGKVIDDSNPFIDEEAAKQIIPVSTVKLSRKEQRKQNKKVSMSFWTAVRLSLSNMITKKGRTVLTVVAGSIGIIGIALVLSVSNGFQHYIDRVQEDALSSFPITVERSTTDLTSMYTTIMEDQDKEITHDMDNIYSNDIIIDILNSLSDKTYKNDLKNFKTLIDTDETLQSYINDAKYNYDVKMNVYSPDTTDGVLKINPSHLVKEALSDNDITLPPTLTADVWTEMMDNDQLLDSQYEIVAGAWPQDKSQVVLVIDKNNEISDYTLYTLGLKTENELITIINNNQRGVTTPPSEVTYTYDDILNLQYKLVLQSDLYEKETNNTWSEIASDENEMKDVIDNAYDINVAGIVKLKAGVTVGSINGTIGYTHDLLTYMITANNNSEIVQAQIASPQTDIFSGTLFPTEKMTMDQIYAMMAMLPPEQQSTISNMITMFGEEVVLEMFNDAGYDDNLSTLGCADLDNPTSISIYAKDFEAKDDLEEYIDEYNKKVSIAGEPEKIIKYTDYVAIVFSSVSTIINSVTYVLIGFVSISLIVSCIMIGIITHISVLERIKEIGILRSVGASKKDISTVFNAETLLIGIASGIFGIAITLILCWPLNVILFKLTDISRIASLPWLGAIALIAISALLTFIAGLIPSHKASKKDPVEALRSE